MRDSLHSDEQSRFYYGFREIELIARSSCIRTNKRLELIVPRVLRHMAQSFLLKLTLLTDEGISLAEYPEATSIAQAQLAGGLINALMSFAKQIHQRELQSLAYHDRTVSFLAVNSFLLISEISSFADPVIVPQFLAELSVRAQQVLFGWNAAEISLEEAREITAALADENIILGKLGYKRPLEGAASQVVVLPREGMSDISLSDTYHSSSLAIGIEKMLEFASRFESGKDYYTSFLPLPKDGLSAYVLILLRDHNVEIGTLAMPISPTHDLFRLTPLLDQRADNLMIAGGKTELSTMLDSLSKTYDVGTIKGQNLGEDGSASFLKKSVKKRLENGLYSVIVGTPVVVIGDKTSVRVAVATLALFGQHRVLELIPWLEEGDQIGRCVTGMSNSVYTSLSENGYIPEGTTIVDLDQSRVIGGVSNRWTKNLFDKIVKKSNNEAIAIVGNELNALVDTSHRLAALATLPMEQARALFLRAKQDIPDSHRFEAAVEMARRRTLFLEDALNELSTAVQRVEDFLDEF